MLKGRIPGRCSARLQDAAEDGSRMPARSTKADAPRRGLPYAERGGERRMFRVDYLHGKRSAASLELLGSPAVLGIAESLGGPNFVPTYESLVFKDAGDGAAIDWHQDAVHPRTHRIFNIDVYLDASRAGEGALCASHRSHLAPVDVCQLQEEYGWDAPGVIQVELEPGDVLVHDVMVVHGSEAVRGNRLRRTIYYEFRSAPQIAAEGPGTPSGWIADCDWSRWPARAPAPRTRGDGIRSGTCRGRAGRGGDGEAELRIAHGVHSPGRYCSAGSVPF